MRFDAALGWTNLNFDSALGANSGSFTGSLWRGTTGLTGNYILNGFLLQPSARAVVALEHNRAWTDNVGNLTAATDVSAGRTALGTLVARPVATSGGWTISPYAGLYGDWVFLSNSNSNNALPVGPPIAVIKGGWAGRVTAGLTGLTVKGAQDIRLALGGELGGLGAGYKIWTANILAVIPF